jgi:hypothetical protein
MTILEVVILLLLVVLAFGAGLLVAGNYYNKLLSVHEYTEKILAADKGLGYIAPPKRKYVIGQEFMDKLKQNGRATQVLRDPET